MKYKIYAKITLRSEVDPKILEFAIAPENKTMPDGNVITVVNKASVDTIISGEMSIGRLMNTVDDILKTAILAKNVDNEI